ncbi:MAG: xanthine dehydrogenase family protein molybdopterin-binding subunit, partial [Acetobacteraceae bacterium]
FGTAQSVRRVEDPRLLQGRGRYTDDITPPATLHAVVVRSPHAHARIRAIDTAAARRIPGVVGVFTEADLKADGIGPMPCEVSLKNRDGSDNAAPPRPALTGDFARFVGDQVALVVADTLNAARDGAGALAIDYEILPSITDLARSTDEDASRVWPEVARNICFDWEIGDKRATDAAFARASHVSRIRVVNNRIVVCSMETRAAIGQYDADSGRWTLSTGTQGGWLLKRHLGTIFGVDPERFQVLTPDVGGGFGMKSFLYPEHVLVCFAARRLGKAVKWTSERAEAFLSDTHGRDNVSDAELALGPDGSFLALRTHILANMGAYLSAYAPYIPTYAGTWVLPGVYQFRTAYANVLGVFTNTVPVDAYRGAGRPESNYLLERLIDFAAMEIGIDRVELRRRNMVQPASLPWTTPVGKVYDSGDFGKVLEVALGKADWSHFPARKKESLSRGKKRGIGLAYYLESTGGSPTERAEIRFTEDRFVDVFVGTQSNGQGHETAYVQITSERLGVAAERIRIRQGDTDQIPVGGGTGGARSLYSEGQAILATTASVIDKGRQAASEALEASAEDIAFEDGEFRISGTDRSVEILELAARQRARVAAGEGATLLDAVEIAPIPAPTFPNGCHIAEVEIDPETGVVDVVRYTVADDFGTLVNPMIARGQVHGGVAQGIGQASLELSAYDGESGQLLSGSFMDYTLPRADDLPNIDVEFVEVPCRTNPLGVKGAGEAGAVGSAPAVMNAILDGLRDSGVTKLDMPAGPERVWRALQHA